VEITTSHSSTAADSRHSSFTPASRCQSASRSAHRCRRRFVFGIGFSTRTASAATGTNTFLEELNPQQLTGDAEATFAVDSLDLVEGT